MENTWKCLSSSPTLNTSLTDQPDHHRSKKPPHHTLEGVVRVGSLVQQLAVLQLLTHPLQGVERLVQLHWHLHFGEVFANVVPEDVPQADADVRAGHRKTGSPLR